MDVDIQELEAIIEATKRLLTQRSQELSSLRDELGRDDRRDEREKISTMLEGHLKATGRTGIDTERQKHQDDVLARVENSVNQNRLEKALSDGMIARKRGDAETAVDTAPNRADIKTRLVAGDDFALLHAYGTFNPDGSYQRSQAFSDLPSQGDPSKKTIGPQLAALQKTLDERVGQEIEAQIQVRQRELAHADALAMVRERVKARIQTEDPTLLDGALDDAVDEAMASEKKKSAEVLFQQEMSARIEDAINTKATTEGRRLTNEEITHIIETFAARNGIVELDISVSLAHFASRHTFVTQDEMVTRLATGVAPDVAPLTTDTLTRSVDGRIHTIKTHDVELTSSAPKSVSMFKDSSATLHAMEEAYALSDKVKRLAPELAVEKYDISGNVDLGTTWETSEDNPDEGSPVRVNRGVINDRLDKTKRHDRLTGATVILREDSEHGGMTPVTAFPTRSTTEKAEDFDEGTARTEQAARAVKQATEAVAAAELTLTEARQKAEEQELALSEASKAVGRFSKTLTEDTPQDVGELVKLVVAFHKASDAHKRAKERKEAADKALTELTDSLDDLKLQLSDDATRQKVELEAAIKRLTDLSSRTEAQEQELSRLKVALAQVDVSTRQATEKLDQQKAALSESALACAQALTKAETAVTDARETGKAKQSGMHLTSDDFKKLSKLIKTGERARAELDTARVGLKQARAEVQLASARLEEATRQQDLLARGESVVQAEELQKAKTALEKQMLDAIDGAGSREEKLSALERVREQQQSQITLFEEVFTQDRAVRAERLRAQKELLDGLTEQLAEAQEAVKVLQDEEKASKEKEIRGLTRQQREADSVHDQLKKDLDEWVASTTESIEEANTALEARLESVKKARGLED